MKKITKRDIFVFCLGFITFLAIETALDWEGSKMAFKRGRDSAHQEDLERDTK